MRRATAYTSVTITKREDCVRQFASFLHCFCSCAIRSFFLFCPCAVPFFPLNTHAPGCQSTFVFWDQKLLRVVCFQFRLSLSVLHPGSEGEAADRLSSRLEPPGWCRPNIPHVQPRRHHAPCSTFQFRTSACYEGRKKSAVCFKVRSLCLKAQQLEINA